MVPQLVQNVIITEKARSKCRDFPQLAFFCKSANWVLCLLGVVFSLHIFICLIKAYSLLKILCTGRRVWKEGSIRQWFDGWFGRIPADLAISSITRKADFSSNKTDLVFYIPIWYGHVYHWNGMDEHLGAWQSLPYFSCCKWEMRSRVSIVECVSTLFSIRGQNMIR